MRRTEPERREARSAIALAAPALAVIALVALFPLADAIWDSLHLHDLRMPWLGKPLIGAGNYLEILGASRFWEALGHTLIFTGASVSLEMLLGLTLALALDRTFRGRGALRAALLVPWALPTVVAAMIWRFLFDGQSGPVNALLRSSGAIGEPIVWLGSSPAAWIPVILADVWKTTPFVALLLLAGLQTIDPEIQEAARVDGASLWRRLFHVTLPLLRPALLVALIFRTLDAFRVFDLIFVMTGGGPGTSTEPVSLYAYTALMRQLRFGYGSALSVVVFGCVMLLALAYVRLLGADLVREK